MLSTEFGVEQFTGGYKKTCFDFAENWNLKYSGQKTLDVKTYKFPSIKLFPSIAIVPAFGWGTYGRDFHLNKWQYWLVRNQ
jgi:hypothetical protein